MTNIEIELTPDPKTHIPTFRSESHEYSYGLGLIAEIVRDYFPYVEPVEGQTEQWFVKGELADTHVLYRSSREGVLRRMGLGDVETIEQEIEYVLEEREASGEVQPGGTKWSLICKHQIPTRQNQASPSLRWFALQMEGDGSVVSRIRLSDSIHDPVDPLHNMQPEGDSLELILNPDTDMYDLTFTRA